MRNEEIDDMINWFLTVSFGKRNSTESFQVNEHVVQHLPIPILGQRMYIQTIAKSTP